MDYALTMCTPLAALCIIVAMGCGRIGFPNTQRDSASDVDSNGFPDGSGLDSAGLDADARDSAADSAVDVGPDVAGDGPPVDAGGDALACSGTCADGCGMPCCADECSSPLCPTCQPRCTCYQACGGPDCETLCSTGSRCFLDSRSVKGTVQCDGADCRIDCGDSGFDFDCEMSCVNDATCEMHCNGVDDCEVYCSDTSRCLLDCASLGGVCQIYDCLAPVSCSATVSVCNRSCP
jgi:hypothetical protein